ncbi:MAG: GPP34 family phosphoprotein [Bacteroidales bacterium]|nr:GPP34 family phosphoprotein [Bacteroidales bacterium]
MKLTIPEKLIILSYDPKKGRSMVPKTNLQFALAGSILFELTLREKIGIKKEFLLVKDMDPVKEEWLNEYLEMMKDATEDRKAKWWVKKFATKIKPTHNQLLESLIEKGILRKERQRKFLGLVTVNTYPSSDPETLNSLIGRIRKAVLSEKNYSDELVMLISLIGACKLTRKFFRNRKEYNKARNVTRDIMRGNLVGKVVDDSIKAMHAAITAAVTASSATTAAAGSSN